MAQILYKIIHEIPARRKRYGPALRIVKKEFVIEFNQHIQDEETDVPEENRTTMEYHTIQTKLESLRGRHGYATPIGHALEYMKMDLRAAMFAHLLRQMLDNRAEYKRIVDLLPKKGTEHTLTSLKATHLETRIRKEIKQLEKTDSARAGWLANGVDQVNKYIQPPDFQQWHENWSQFL